MGIRDLAQLPNYFCSELKLSSWVMAYDSRKKATVLGESERPVRVGDGKGLGGKHVSRWLPE